MPLFFDAGVAKNIIVAGATCITTVNSQIIGVLLQSSATGNVQLWAGTTATGAGLLSGVIRQNTGAVSAAPALYFPFPAYASGGITINVGASADPNITLFWCPTGTS